MFGDRGLNNVTNVPKNSSVDKMQPCLTALPTTKGAERVPLCSTRHLAPSYVDLMTDTILLGIPSSQCHPEDSSIHTVKRLFKVYKNQMQIGTVFSTLLNSAAIPSIPAALPERFTPIYWE